MKLKEWQDDKGQKADIITKYEAKAREAGLTPDANRTVGNNGYVVGGKYVATGEIRIVDEVNGNKTAYPAVVCKDGSLLSLRSLMGVSSLNGFNLDNSTVAVSEYCKDDKCKGEKLVHEYKSNLPEDFDPSDLTQPPTRHFYTFMANAADIFTEGTVITYLGSAVRQLTARRKGQFNEEHWDTGFKRAMTVQLWHYNVPKD